PIPAERQYGPIRICLYLQRFHQVYVSVPTIYKILKRHGVPRVSMKRYRPGPRRRREFTVPGQSVQVDVKHLKLGGRRFYQFTAVDEATRYRILRIYTHSSISKCDRVLGRSPPAAPDGHPARPNRPRQRVRHGLHLAFARSRNRPSRIPPGCPEVNGKVERSHRTDEEEFYRRMTFRTAAELTAKLRRWEHEYNHRRPHLALAGRTPAERFCELRIVERNGQAMA